MYRSIIPLLTFRLERTRSRLIAPPRRNTTLPTLEVRQGHLLSTTHGPRASSHFPERGTSFPPSLRKQTSGTARLRGSISRRRKVDVWPLVGKPMSLAANFPHQMAIVSNAGSQWNTRIERRCFREKKANTYQGYHVYHLNRSRNGVHAIKLPPLQQQLPPA